MGDSAKDGDTLPEMLADFLEGDYSRFSELSGAVEDSWKRYSRTLPPELYQFVRRRVLGALGDRGTEAAMGEPREPLKLRVVIDTNTIVFEAFSAARGRASSTSRLFESPFVEVYAPAEIMEESGRIIRSKRPKDVDEARALAHAQLLVSKLRVVGGLTSDALRRARERLMPHAPEDVPFLAVAFDTDSPFVVSTDRVAFDGLESIERWYLKDFATTVVSLESGSLSLVLLGASAEMLYRALEVLVVGFSRAVFQILEVLAGAAVAIATGTVEALSHVPDWAWVLIVGVLVASAAYVGVRAAVDPEFRGKLAEGIDRLFKGAAQVFAALVNWLKEAVAVAHDLLVAIWSVVKPIAALSVLAASVILRRSLQFLEECDGVLARSTSDPAP